MKVGFTGTRFGLTSAQGGALSRWLRDAAVAEFHHGACVGADAEAVTHARHHHPDAVVHAHPSDLRGTTHPTAMALSGTKHATRPALFRNRDIVDACDVLLACPKGPEELQSGTWMTVRYARRQGVRVAIFWPDGTVTEEPRA